MSWSCSSWRRGRGRRCRRFGCRHALGGASLVPLAAAPRESDVALQEASQTQNLRVTADGQTLRYYPPPYLRFWILKVLESCQQSLSRAPTQALQVSRNRLGFPSKPTAVAQRPTRFVCLCH